MAVKTGAKRHTHKYHKINGVWHCARPDCTHFMPGNVADNMEGKKSICWTCGNEMYLDSLALEMDKPTCPSCNSEVSTIADILASKGL